MNRTLLVIGVAALLASNLWVWRTALIDNETLIVSFLDVGQGDAVLIQTPGGIDVLVDGGPDRSVLRRLPRELGPFDRIIDLVVATHLDKDHIAGLIGVFDRYRVSYFLESGVEKDSPFAESLHKAAEEEPEARSFIARKGMRIHMGDAYADVLFPDRDVSRIEGNDGSIALRIVYGDTSFLMAGDLSSKVEDYIAASQEGAVDSDVLKASHHGSRTSTSATWLAAVSPSVVVVSAGKGNSYGHPAPEVVDRVQAFGARLMSTIDLGTITLVSDRRVIKEKRPAP